MSSEGPPPPRPLADYLRTLISGVERWEPASFAAIRRTAGRRRARIVLGGETASIGFGDGRFVVRRLPRPPALAIPLPYGRTDRQTAVALIAGHLEASDAIMDGRLEIHGSADDVADICALIEMLIDASTRIPDLQQLAREFRASSTADLAAERRAGAERRRLSAELADREEQLLRRYGLVS